MKTYEIIFQTTDGLMHVSERIHANSKKEAAKLCFDKYQGIEKVVIESIVVNEILKGVSFYEANLEGYNPI